VTTHFDRNRPRAHSEDIDGARVITIDNPGIRNALDDETRRSLRNEIINAAGSAARVVVLTGAEGTFCAGGELRSMPTDDQKAMRSRVGEMHDIIRAIITAPQPIIAAVEGFAFGSGLSIAVACDYVVAAADAQLGFTFGRVGLVPDCGILWSLPQRVGLGRAKDLLLRSAIVNADEAFAIGLVDAVVPHGSALGAALNQAEELAARAPLGLAATKRLLTGPVHILEEFFEREVHEQMALFGSADFVEGRDAFFSSRAPRFRGF
jgi:2-(1,2-epoxy-1,2-dihydrophenyl)acetyl-CoA isomerase